MFLNITAMMIMMIAYFLALQKQEGGSGTPNTDAPKGASRSEVSDAGCRRKHARWCGVPQSTVQEGQRELGIRHILSR